MTRRQITGFSNPTIKAVRALREKKHRKREGRFLAEGLRLLTDARESGRLPELLLMAEGREGHPLLDALEAAVAHAGGDVIEMPEDLLAKVTGKDNPQAVAGVFGEWNTGLQTMDRARCPLWLVAPAMRDPGNLCTMLRTADAVPLAQARWEEFLGWLRVGAGQLVAASLREAVPYRGAPYAEPCFVMVGNESRGLPEDYEMACDLRVTMPMKGRADSLNAAVAAAVLAYEVLATLGG